MIHGSRQVRRRRHQVGDERRGPAARLDAARSDGACVWPPVRRTVTPGMIVWSSSTSAGRRPRRAARSCPADSSRGSARADASHPPTRRGGRRTARAGNAARTRPSASRIGEAAGVIEVQVGGEHDVDVARRDAGLGQRDRDGARGRRRRCRGTSRSPCRRSPASMSIVRAPRTSSGRIASVMRLRSSAGAFFAHSAFGTTPNIAPPSSRKKPSQQRDQLEIAERESPDAGRLRRR